MIYLIPPLLLFLNVNIYANEVFITDVSTVLEKQEQIPCFTDEGRFNEEYCLKEEMKCSFEATTLGFNTVDISVNPTSKNVHQKIASIPETINSHIWGIEHYKIHYTSMHSPTKFLSYKFPKNSEVTLYENIFERSSLPGTKIIYQGKIPEDGVLNNFEMRPPIHKVKIIFKDLVSDFSIPNLGIFILGKSLSTSAYKDEIEFMLSEGNYDIKFFYTSKDGNSKQYHIVLTVRSDSRGKDIPTYKVLTLNPKQFNIHTLVKDTIHWENNNSVQSPNLYVASRNRKRSYGFYNLAKLNISGMELRSLFEIKAGKINLRTDAAQEFYQRTNHLPLLSIKAEGTCIEYEKKPISNEIDIYQFPDEKSTKLGSFVIMKPSSPQNAYGSIQLGYKAEGKNTQENVKLNLMEGSCRGEGKPVLQHATHEAKDGWFNFGKGSWGKSGWIKWKYEGIEKLGNNFEFGALGRVKFQKHSDGFLLVQGEDLSRSENEIHEVGDESPEVKVQYIIETKRLWDANGDFIPSTDCRYGC